MAGTIHGVRGMHDILPDEAAIWRTVEDAARAVLEAYGYREIRLPLVEPTELFRRSIGEVTDIVEKEMYTFEDAGGSLTLRPEGTAGCVRAGIENGLVGNQVHRLWYDGPMFRRERPQKGRYRQFYQIGVEAFGLEGPDIDAELILMTARLWRRLGARSMRLELNSLGTPQARARYRDDLVAYLEHHHDALDADSRRRLHSNPLRILDSKNPAMQEVIAGAPTLGDYLDDASRAHFDELRALLDDAGVEYRINPRLVRGLDYYTRTVFEWVTDRLGSQGTVCAGGRYDGLVEQLGGRPTPAAGFALGMERLVALLADSVEAGPSADVYIVTVGSDTQRAGFRLAERLREALPWLRLTTHCGGGSFKAQLKRADRSGARLALILGEEEAAAGTVAVKPLRGDGEQEVVRQDGVAERLVAMLRERSEA